MINLYGVEITKLAALMSNALREQSAFRSLMQQRKGSPLGVMLQDSVKQYPNLWFLFGLGLAFLPAALVGFVAHKWIKAYLFSPATVAASLIIGGIIILVVEGRRQQVRVKELLDVTPRSALWVGIAQCASLIPGMSRSGSTIVGGLLAGLDRRVATEYSFFLALPTMIVATIYQTLKSQAVFTRQDYVALAIGLVVSFAVAWAVIAAFLTFVQRHTLRAFAYYRIILGIIVL